MVGSVEYAIAEDRLDEDGELWVPREEDPTAERESSVPFMVTPYTGECACAAACFIDGMTHFYLCSVSPLFK